MSLPEMPLLTYRQNVTKPGYCKVKWWQVYGHTITVSTKVCVYNTCLATVDGKRSDVNCALLARFLSLPSSCHNNTLIACKWVESSITTTSQSSGFYTYTCISIDTRYRAYNAVGLKYSINAVCNVSMHVVWNLDQHHSQGFHSHTLIHVHVPRTGTRVLNVY